MLKRRFGSCKRLIRVVSSREVSFRRPAAADAVRVRMLVQRFLVKRLLQRFEIQPGAARLIEQREVIGHAAKLSPQEQCATAFGFVTLKPPFCRSSL